MMDITSKLHPKLRFDDFNEPLKSQKLIELSIKIGDGIHTTPRYDKSGEYYFINGNNLIKGRIKVFNETKCVNKDEFNKHNKNLDQNTILISINGTIGNIAMYNNEPVVLGKSVCYLKLRKEIYRDYVFYTLQSDRIRKDFSAELTGTTIRNLSLKSISNTLIYLPGNKEQEKIAKFINFVDQYLENLYSQKKELEKYKKGLMQKIFSQEIRFKENNGKNYKNWETKLIKDIFDFLPTNALSRDQLDYHVGTIKNIHYGDIHTKFNQSFVLKEETVPFINSNGSMKFEFCKEGDIVLADASEDYKDVGKTIELLSLDNQDVVAGLHTILLRPRKKYYLFKGFSGYLMRSPEVRNQLMKYATGTSVLSISKSNLAKVEIATPTYEEQEKITTFLSSVDSLIKSKDYQISNATIWKKGLMQEMFV